MQIHFCRLFSSKHTICLLANSRSADRIGASIMQRLKEISPIPIDFVGAGGPNMEQAGLDPDTNLYKGDTFEKFAIKPFIPFRSTNAKEWNEIFKTFKKENWAQKIAQQNPSLVLTIRGDILSFKEHRLLADEFSLSSKQKPWQIHYGKYVTNMYASQLKFLDHLFYTMPLPPNNWQYFTFPSTYVGHQHFFNALQYLLKKHGGDRLLIKDGMLIHRDFFYREMEQFIAKERDEFRHQQGINQSTSVILFVPGNTENEINWSFKTFAKTVPLIRSSNFEILLLVNSTYHPFVQGLMNKFGLKARLMSEKERPGCLAGSDIAVCQNGVIATECLANQLPTILLQDMRKLEYYFMLSWSRMINDLNIIADGPLFPELIEAQYNPEKLSDIINLWLVDPANKFNALEHFETHIKRMLPMKYRTQDMGNQYGIHDQYYEPEKVLLHKLIGFLENYKQQPLPKNQFLENMLA